MGTYYCLKLYISQMLALKVIRPWKVWLTWLGMVRQSERSLGSIPTQGTYLGCGFIPGRARKRGNPWMFLSHMDVCLPPSTSLPLSLKK